MSENIQQFCFKCNTFMETEKCNTCASDEAHCGYCGEQLTLTKVHQITIMLTDNLKIVRDLKVNDFVELLYNNNISFKFKSTRKFHSDNPRINDNFVIINDQTRFMKEKNFTPLGYIKMRIHANLSFTWYSDDNYHSGEDMTDIHRLLNMVNQYI